MAVEEMGAEGLGVEDEEGGGEDGCRVVSWKIVKCKIFRQ